MAKKRSGLLTRQEQAIVLQALGIVAGAIVSLAIDRFLPKAGSAR